MKNPKGFTLVEIIVVILIMAVLAAVALPPMLGYINEATNAKYVQQAMSIYNTLQVEQARFQSDHQNTPLATIYQDETATAKIIDQVNAMLESELDLNGLVYYPEAARFQDETVPAQSFLLDFVALDGLDKTALVKYNQRIIIFEGNGGHPDYLDGAYYASLFDPEMIDDKNNPNAHAKTTRNFQNHLLENGGYPQLTPAETALIGVNETLYWVPIVEPVNHTVYFAAYDQSNKTGAVISQMVWVDGKYYVHHKANSNYQGAIDERYVSDKGSDYALLSQIANVAEYIDCNPKSHGYWQIVK